jgi:hypothetical protein
MLRRLRTGFVLAALGVALAATSGCGEASKATVSYTGNARPITSYIGALERIMAPLHDFPLHPNEYVEATRVLQRATRELVAQTPPRQFRVSHDLLLTNLRAQLALIPQRQRALRARDAPALLEIRAEDIRQQNSVRTALAEAKEELERCTSDGFVC